MIHDSFMIQLRIELTRETIYTENANTGSCENDGGILFREMTREDSEKQVRSIFPLNSVPILDI